MPRHARKEAPTPWVADYHGDRSVVKDANGEIVVWLCSPEMAARIAEAVNAAPLPGGWLRAIDDGDSATSEA